MKINPEVANIINLVKKDESYQKKAQEKETEEMRQKIADVIKIENKQASTSRLETVEQAKDLLDDVTKEMENYSTDLYKVNNQRISSLIS